MTAIVTATNELSAIVVPILWRASWQGGLMLLLVFSLCRAAPRISPELQCWLWRLAYLKLLFVCMWIVPLELHWLPTRTPTSATDATGSSPPPSIASTGNIILPEWIGASGRQSVSTPRLTGLGWLQMAWMIGLTIMLGRLIRHGLQVRCLMSRFTPVTSAVVTERLQEHCRQIGIRRVPGIRSAFDGSGPFLAGPLRPVIVLPVAVIDSENRHELDAVLLHELAHIKRRDLLWNWLPALGEAVFFFHPFMWLTRRDQLLAQEIAADELAVTAYRPDISEYAKCLVEVVRRSNNPQIVPHFGVALSEAFIQMSRRIGAMQTFRPHSMRRRVRLTLTLAVLVLLGIVPWKLTAQEPKQAAAPALPSTIQSRSSSSADATTSAVDQKAVRGIVRDEGGAPVAEATVVAGAFREGDMRRQTLKTDAGGRFVTHFTPDEAPLVVAYKAGWSLAATWLRLREHRHADEGPLELTLLKPEPFVGRVQDATGQAIGGATVRAELFTTHQPNDYAHLNHLLEIVLAGTELDGQATTKTNSDGSFSLTSFPKDAQVMLKVGAPGKGLFRSMMYHDNGKKYLRGTVEDPAIVTLQPEGVISGQVTTTLSGVSVEGLTVHLQASNNSTVIADPYFVKTDADGRFQFGGLAAGTANVFLVEHPPDGPWTYRAAQDVDVRSGEQSSIAIELIEGRIVEGEVVDNAGKPVPGAGIGVYGPVRPESGAAIIRDDTKTDGSYRFHLPPGRAQIYFCGPPPGYSGAGVYFDVPEGTGKVRGPTLTLQPVEDVTAHAATPEKAFKTKCQCYFEKTALKDVAAFVSKVHEVPVRLDAGVDGAAPITIKQEGTLKEMFDTVLPSLGLEYSVDAKEIVIRKKKAG